MICDDALCHCQTNPRDYVPVCPRHGLPLRAADADPALGTCPWFPGNSNTGPGFPERAPQGGYVLRPTADRCLTWRPQSWSWRHRDTFNTEDLPPYNGWKPPDYDHEGPRWATDLESYCRDCKSNQPVIVGPHELVCITCGAAYWRAEGDTP